MNTITLAWTGASGLPYGFRLLECLLQSGISVQLLYSQAAQIVCKQEMSFTLPTRPADARKALLVRYPDLPGTLQVYGRDDWFAPAASGSGVADAMIICPATMGCVAAVAQGLSDNLIERAADVILKERRPLILVPREAPFSVIHLENLLRLARAGAVIMPPSPGFYHHPKSVGDIVDFVVARTLDQLGIKHQLQAAWGT